VSSRRSVPTLCLLCVLLPSAACSSRSPLRRVSTSGRDAGDCLAGPCRTIGYAVRQASAGDTIVVDSGTYRESVLVTKRLVLVGHHATIDASGQSSPPNGFQISGDGAAGTRVAGFTIRNAGLEGIFVVGTSRVTIENNTLLGNDAYGTSNPLCTNHQDDCGEAIHLQAVTGSVVRGNVIRNNLGGILLTDEDGPAADDTISDNLVTDNPKDCGITLASHWIDTTSTTAVSEGIAGVYRNVIVHNTSNHNGGAGIGIFAAGPGGAAWGNVVIGNTSTNNLFSGLAIHSHTPAQNVDGNVFRDNILAGNGTDVENPADHEPAGISVFSAVGLVRNTVVTGNRISNEHYGVITLHADPIPNLEKNTFDDSVKEPTSVH
jgi:parallel beta-helix repeat protein